MTLAQFRSLIQSYSDIIGQPYLADTDTSGWNALINERLAALSDYTLTFDALATPLTLTPGTSTYNYRTTTPIMSRVAKVSVNGNLLKDREGEYGPYPYEEFFNDFPSYATDSGQPKRFVLLSPSQVLLHPNPDSAYTTYLIGQRRHATLSSDSDVLEIPDQYLRAAARYVWITANEPYAEEESLDKIARIGGGSST